MGKSIPCAGTMQPSSCLLFSSARKPEMVQLVADQLFLLGLWVVKWELTLGLCSAEKTGQLEKVYHPNSLLPTLSGSVSYQLY